jgi:hypothetical protein
MAYARCCLRASAASEETAERIIKRPGYLSIPGRLFFSAIYAAMPAAAIAGREGLNFDLRLIAFFL